MLDRWVADQIGVPPPLTRPDLDEWLLRRLRSVVAYARGNSPYYREHLPETPIGSLADFAALPFLMPADLAAQGNRLLCVRADQVDRIVTTSGSTGPPKRVCSTREDQETTAAFFREGMRQYVAAGERVLSLFPGSSPGSLNDLLRQGLSRLGCPMTIFGYPELPRRAAALDTILAEKISCVVGPVSAVAALARQSRDEGRAEAVGAQLRGVLLAAEAVPPAARREIADLWHCEVHEHYGMTETGFAGAVSCGCPDTLHIWEGGLYYEIVHPETGAPVPEGETGALTVTTLTRRAMPVIRYRTGDRTRFLPGPCPCGSVLRRIAPVGSRPQPKKFQRRVLPDTLDDG